MRPLSWLRALPEPRRSNLILLVATVLAVIVAAALLQCPAPTVPPLPMR